MCQRPKIQLQGSQQRHEMAEKILNQRAIHGNKAIARKVEKKRCGEVGDFKTEESEEQD